MNQRQLSNVVQMTVKEIRSLWHDKILLFLIIWVFSGGIYVASTATSMELHNAPIAIVDEDRSPLSQQLRDAFYGPYFKTPELIDLDEIDPALFAGRYTFVLAIIIRIKRESQTRPKATLIRKSKCGIIDESTFFLYVPGLRQVHFEKMLSGSGNFTAHNSFHICLFLFEHLFIIMASITPMQTYLVTRFF